MKPTEKQIQDSIIDYLRRKKYYVMRLNSGKMSYTYKGKRAFMNLLPAGTPDLIAFKALYPGEPLHAKLYFIEVKKPGNKLTVLQEEKMKELERYGSKCIVATSIDDLERL